MSKDSLIYLDNNATTQADPRVADIVHKMLITSYGNPASNTHAAGWEADQLVEQARASVATAVGAEPSEIIFTSGATESNNLAIVGSFNRLAASGKRAVRIITAATEHPAVLEPIEELKFQGADVVVLSVNRDGSIDRKIYSEAIATGEGIGIVSLMLANNEVGTIHPIAELAHEAQARGYVFHCDATQALGKIEVNFAKLGVDLLSVTAHKCYGPKGVGALIKSQGLRLSPLVLGGGQEQAIRAGTLNSPGIAGFGEACHILHFEQNADVERIRALTSRLYRGLQARSGKIILNGPELDQRLPGNLNIQLGVVSAGVVGKLSTRVAFSISSACHSKNSSPSHVLAALGLSLKEQSQSVRLSIGKFNTESEIDRTIDLFGDAL